MRRPALFTITALALLAGCGDAPARFGAVSVGDAAPAFAATTLDGGRDSLAARRGSAVLLNVWATWCAPCREEIPALELLHEEYGAAGLGVVGVSIDQRGQERAIREFLAEFGATYPVWLDPSGDVQSIFGTVGVPSTYLIDPGGRVVWKHVGPVRADDGALRALIEESLAATTRTGG
jgi:cytochrome c biogenesis protein CcmG, thiol:disulfide interchange protein DsbE